jgi:hypothetical protein
VSRGDSAASQSRWYARSSAAVVSPSTYTVPSGSLHGGSIGVRLHHPEHVEGAIPQVAFRADGLRVATASTDATAQDVAHPARGSTGAGLHPGPSPDRHSGLESQFPEPRLPIPCPEPRQPRSYWAICGEFCQTGFRVAQWSGRRTTANVNLRADRMYKVGRDVPTAHFYRIL